MDARSRLPSPCGRPIRRRTSSVRDSISDEGDLFPGPGTLTCASGAFARLAFLDASLPLPLSQAAHYAIAWLRANAIRPDRQPDGPCCLEPADAGPPLVPGVGLMPHLHHSLNSSACSGLSRLGARQTLPPTNSVVASRQYPASSIVISGAFTKHRQATSARSKAPCSWTNCKCAALCGVNAPCMPTATLLAVGKPVHTATYAHWSADSGPSGPPGSDCRSITMTPLYTTPRGVSRGSGVGGGLAKICPVFHGDPLC